MAELKVISELGLNDTLLVLEPARRCVGRCTWCYVELNRAAARSDGRQRRLEGEPTFERALARAFGPDYDPENFLQWGLRNRLPFTWSSGVEPFQDVVQAQAVLDAVDRFDLPLFVQTRGTHWRAVWDQLKTRADNAALYVSMPSDDPAVIKRFEPATPPPAEREALLRAAVDAGFPVMLALAPYHPDWCADLPAYVARAIGWGVKAFLFDPLHLNQTQRATATDRALLDLADTSFGPRAIAQVAEARALVLEHGLSWWATNWEAPLHRLESVNPLGWIHYRNAQPFGYHDALLFDELHGLAEDDDAAPLLVTWDDVLAVLEHEGTIAQPFAWSSLMGTLRCARTLPAAWQARLRPAATLREMLRALWNNPSGHGFVWRHPFVRLAVRPDGAPWLSASGDVVMVFDPNYTRKALRRVVEDLGALDSVGRKAE